VGQSLWRRIFKWPSTRLGWWAVRLALAFEILMTLNFVIFMRLPEEVAWRVTILPIYAITMLLCGLAAGIVGLIAMVRQRERSGLVGLTLLPGLFVLVFVLGEFMSPH
jgi:hypothetical protein